MVGRTIPEVRLIQKHRFSSFSSPHTDSDVLHGVVPYSTFKKLVYVFTSFIRIITTLTRPVSEWVLDALYTLVLGKTKMLPPIDNPILLMSATEVAEKIRKRQLRAEEVMAAYVQRCKSVNPIINAITDEQYEEAMKDAVAVDRLIESGVKSESQLAAETPLLGVPFTCKEAIGVKGFSQNCGIYQSRDRKATADSDTAALYRAAGAIPVCVTNVPEMCMWWESANHCNGWTKNPYDNRRTVGGSSGGEGAIITACGPPIGIGNDIAGSIRIPASFCGIYGHKPSRNLISNKGFWPEDSDEYDQFVSTGPMCRYVDDLPKLTRILSGKNAKKVPYDDAPVDFRKVKIYYMEEFPGWLLSATNDIKAAVRKAANHFKEEFGVNVVKLHIPELQHAFCIWECKLLETGGPAFKTALAEDGNISLAWEFIKSIFRSSEHTWPALYFAAVDRRNKDKYYHKCLEMYEELKRKLEEYLQGDAILLIPTHPDPPPHYLMTIPKYPNIGYTCIFSILGYPSTQIPTGLSRNLPIGIQAISTQYKDHLTLAAATELDKVFGGWINPGPTAL